MLQRLRRAGFNRISIGVQSDSDEQLKALGRPHNYKQAQQAVSLARRAGFGNVSVDLMFGLPSQSREQWMGTLRNILDLKADHISCYGLKVEKGTKLYDYRECANLPDDDAQADMYFYAVETLESFGYYQYEISNFAKDGFICRHNMKYWVGDEYLGFGPCAASDFAGKRFTIEPNLEKYIDGVMHKGVVLSECEPVPLRERAGEYLMLRLRTVDGVEENEYTRSFLLPFKPLEKVFLQLQKGEYADCTNGRWHLTPKGFMISNTIIVQLLEEQEKSKPLAQKK
jgi:putative oxygen-independent coproporphyrinogen III oxidase